MPAATITALTARLFRKGLPGGALVLLVVLFGLGCATFVRQPELASFADDSVSYLVMAQVFSPWGHPGSAVASAFAQEAAYPPLFPLVLALFASAHDIAKAHLMEALLLAGCLPLAFLLGRRWLESGWAALAAVAVTSSLPALWINAKGILSEPLYCALLLATLCMLELAPSRGRSWALALAMAALVLTRTAGFALLGAYAAWAITRGERSFPSRLRLASPVLAAVLAYGAWLALRPAQALDENAHVLSARLHGYLADAAAWNGLFASLARQANAMAEGWIGSWLIYWVEGRPLRPLLAGTLGVLALAGLVLRLRSGRADAWIMAAYLATYLLWPFYDQMGRFLFPALPVLVLYAFYAARAAAQRLSRPPSFAYAIVGALAASLSLPALAFIRERSTAPASYAQMTEWYRTADPRLAKARADVHLDLLSDMRAMRTLTPSGSKVMWVKPSYIALLADREGIRAPDARLSAEEYRRIVESSGADYVFLSTYDPRDTLSDAAWQAGMRALNGRAKLIRVGKRSGTDSVASALFQVR